MTHPRYLIFTASTQTSFFTHWFDVENHYCEGDVVFDFLGDLFTTDGKEWKPITEDHL